MKVEKENASFRYMGLADYMESKIKAGVYKSGEKLPSIRNLRKRTGLSITTVHQAYLELENRGVAEPRPKSGYYVRPLLKNIMPAPELEKHEASPRKVSVGDLFRNIVTDMSDPGLIQLGGACPSPELFPYKDLAKTIRGNSASYLKYGVATYENPEGNPELRRQIARRALAPDTGVGLDENEIVTTNGCMDAIHLCLRATTSPGDVVAVESPTFHGFLQLLEDLNLYALEVPSDPKEGIDLDQLEKALEANRVKAGLFVPNFQNPLGSLMPEANKKRLVEMFADRGIPVIEDGIYRELYFGDHRPRTLKYFDKGRNGPVLLLFFQVSRSRPARGMDHSREIPGQDRPPEAKYRDKLRDLEPSHGGAISEDRSVRPPFAKTANSAEMPGRGPADGNRPAFPRRNESHRPGRWTRGLGSPAILGGQLRNIQPGEKCGRGRSYGAFVLHTETLPELHSIELRQPVDPGIGKGDRAAGGNCREHIEQKPVI